MLALTNDPNAAPITGVRDEADLRSAVDCTPATLADPSRQRSVRFVQHE
jgi:hypothetical protein